MSESPFSCITQAIESGNTQEILSFIESGCDVDEEFEYDGVIFKFMMKQLLFYWLARKVGQRL